MLMFDFVTMPFSVYKGTEIVPKYSLQKETATKIYLACLSLASREGDVFPLHSDELMSI